MRLWHALCFTKNKADDVSEWRGRRGKTQIEIHEVKGRVTWTIAGMFAKYALELSEDPFADLEGFGIGCERHSAK